MNKCDFCTRSSPDGKCFWDSAMSRESDCRKAIYLMVEALKGVSKEEKIKRFKR